jgi:hypothetical protein
MLKAKPATRLTVFDMWMIEPSTMLCALFECCVGRLVLVQLSSNLTWEISSLRDDGTALMSGGSNPVHLSLLLKGVGYDVRFSC